MTGAHTQEYSLLTNKQTGENNYKGKYEGRVFFSTEILVGSVLIPCRMSLSDEFNLWKMAS